MVHRSALSFNDEECEVLNFTDLSTFYHLEQEKETNRLLKMLTASVSHEMLAPLGATIEIAEILLEHIENERQRRMLQMIITSSRLVFCHSNDLLDYNLLEHGKLVPNLEVAALETVLLEILEIASVDSKSNALEYDLRSIRHVFARFDKRRLQQVLLNMALNAIKFTRNGTIKFKANIIPPGEQYGCEKFLQI